MTVAEKPRNKRIFIASSTPDVAEVRKAMLHLNVDSVMLEQAATPGTTWVDSLHRCVNDADMVLGIMGDRRKDTNVFFELGVASALNKPTLLFITPDYPIDLVPPSGIPYLRMDLQNEDAIVFGLKQALSLSPRDRSRPSAEGFTTRPIGPIADQLLARLPKTAGNQFEDLIDEAIKASGASTIARRESEGRGIDFAVWSSDLEPNVANPLLIECKTNFSNQQEVEAAIEQMSRALGGIPNGFGIVLYKEEVKGPKLILNSHPDVVVVAAATFISGLRDNGLAEYVRNLRNATIHGL